MVSGCQGPRGENIVNILCYFIQGQLAVSFKFFCVSGEENCGLTEKGRGSVSTYRLFVKLCTGDMEIFPKLIHFHTACDCSDWVVTVPSQISFTKCPNGYPPSMEMSRPRPSRLGSLVPVELSAEGVLQG